MDGMLTHRFSGWTDSDLAVSHSFHHEFAPHAAICELSLTSVNEWGDQAGTNLGFTSYTYVDADGTPHQVDLDWAARRANVGHDRMTRVEWYMRIFEVDSAGLLNIYFWPSVR
ncbi:MAG: hypothetical protein ABI807_11355 [Sporichthyaceae bacterium]